MPTPFSRAQLSLEQDPRIAFRTETGNGRQAIGEDKRQPAELAGRRAEAGEARRVGEWTGLQHHTTPVGWHRRARVGRRGGGDGRVGGWVVGARGYMR